MAPFCAHEVDRVTGALITHVKRRLVGEHPLRLLPFLVPTALSVLVDVIVRNPFSGKYVQVWPLYLHGVCLSLSFWVLVLWLFANTRSVPLARSMRSVLEVSKRGLLAVAIAAMAYCGLFIQVHYLHQSGDFFGPKTIALGITNLDSLRSGILSTWPVLLTGVLVSIAFTGLMLKLAGRAANGLASASLHIPLICIVYLVFSSVELSTWAQGIGCVPPDVSFAQSLGTWMQGSVHYGMSSRTPLPVPPLHPKKKRTVLFVLSESLRAEVLSSERDPARPSPMDEFVPDRFGLLAMTSQTSCTVISTVTTLTGLAPDYDVKTGHQAPLLFEIARAAGYRTAYISAQNGNFDRLNVFFQNAGLDERAFASDLIAEPNIQYGAPDELAARRTLDSLRSHPEPAFVMMHLSATHYPYLVRADLSPYQPETDKVGREYKDALHNRARNAALLQEHVMADFYRELKSLPQFEDMVVIFVSDHGEQFYEHGALSHIQSVHEEEIRVPGYVVAGPSALANDQRDALKSARTRRVYNQDLYATIVDLLGIWDERGSIPLADRRKGRSLVRALDADEPMVLLTNQNGLWEDDNPAFGAMQGNWKLQGRPSVPFQCFDLAHDPGELQILSEKSCPPALARFADEAFPFIPK